MAYETSVVKFCCVTFNEVILVSHQTEPENYLHFIASILPRIPKVPGENKLIFPAHNFQINVLGDDSGLMYICITDPSNGQLFPFTFLDITRIKFKEIPGLTEKAVISQENELQSDFAPVLAAITFDFNKCQCEKLTALENEVHDVKRIVLKNVDKFIERGEKLEDLVAESENISLVNNDSQRRGKCKDWKMWILIGSVLGPILLFAFLIAAGIILL